MQLEINERNEHEAKNKALHDKKRSDAKIARRANILKHWGQAQVLYMPIGALLERVASPKRGTNLFFVFSCGHIFVCKELEKGEVGKAKGSSTLRTSNALEVSRIGVVA